MATPEVSLRNYFAATADVGWMRGCTAEEAEAKTGVKAPAGNPIPADKLAKFWIRVEVTWRWIYADLMLDGFKVSDERVDKIPKEKSSVLKKGDSE